MRFTIIIVVCVLSPSSSSLSCSFSTWCLSETKQWQEKKKKDREGSGTSREKKKKRRKMKRQLQWNKREDESEMLSMRGCHWEAWQEIRLEREREQNDLVQEEEDASSLRRGNRHENCLYYKPREKRNPAVSSRHSNDFCVNEMHSISSLESLLFKERQRKTFPEEVFSLKNLFAWF